MKTISLVFLSVFISTVTFSQVDKADYNDDYWSFGDKDVADFYTSENKTETEQFKGGITFYSIDNAITGNGKTINGKKDGVWIGYFNNGKTYFNEWYNKGKLKKGVSYDIAGKQYLYTKETLNPYPQNGWNDFVMYVQSYWDKVSDFIEKKYPKNFKLLKNKEIEVSFVIIINEDGTADVGEIANGTNYGFDKTAAKKMVSNYKNKWMPALLKGQIRKSKVIYTVKIKF